MTKERKIPTPKYPIATIYTEDPNDYKRIDAVRQNGITHNDIYMAGLEVFENGK